MAVARHWRFPDHYPYQPKDLERLVAEAQVAKLDFLLTTEKDAVKLTRFATGEMRIIYPEVQLTPGEKAGELDRCLEQVFSRG
jgi:tetraacyldisaccharide 4'-kinase